MRVVLIRHTNISKIDLYKEIKIKPSIRNDLARVKIALWNTILARRHLVRNEECYLNTVFVLDTSQFLMHSFYIFLLEHKEFLMQHFSVIIDYDPEWFLFPIPPI